MIHKILNMFGIMTIKRAKNLSKRLHLHYARCVVDGVERDFGIAPNPDHIKQEQKWWGIEFSKLIALNCIDVSTDDNPCFNDYKQIRENEGWKLQLFIYQSTE